MHRDVSFVRRPRRVLTTCSAVRPLHILLHTIQGEFWHILPKCLLLRVADSAAELLSTFGCLVFVRTIGEIGLCDTMSHSSLCALRGELMDISLVPRDGLPHSRLVVVRVRVVGRDVELVLLLGVLVQDHLSKFGNSSYLVLHFRSSYL